MTITNSKKLVPQALVRDALEPYGVDPTEAQVESIQRYLAMLLLWNQKLSLTSLKDPGEILERHFGECMFASSAVPISDGRLADVGTGAGFPGLALKIICPALQVILIDSNVKKSVFLSEVVRSLGFGGAEVVRSRFEDVVVRPGFADFVSARAVGGFDRILRWSLRALPERGQVLLWLGAADAERVSAGAGWGWREPISIPRSNRRVLLVGRPAPF